MDKRPGLYFEPIDFAKVKKELKEKFNTTSETDIASYVMYPKVFEDYRKFVDKYGDLSVLDTKYFLNRPEIGEEFHVELEKGKILILKLLAIGPLSDTTGQREVFYEVNGEVRQVTVDDNKAAVENKSRPKADANDSSQVGAPMSGVVVEVRVKDGTEVKKGDPIAVLSAMKMVSTFWTFCVDLADTFDRKWSSARLIPARSMICRSKKATQLMVRTWFARLGRPEGTAS